MLNALSREMHFGAGACHEPKTPQHWLMLVAFRPARTSRTNEVLRVEQSVYGLARVSAEIGRARVGN
jgi:hypothetical protein